MNTPEKNADSSGTLLLCFSIFAVLGIVVWVNLDHLRRAWNFPGAKATPAARALPEWTHSRARAAKKFPDLDKEGSPLRQAYEDLKQRAQVDRPEIFDNPDWPMILALEARASLR